MPVYCCEFTGRHKRNPDDPIARVKLHVDAPNENAARAVCRADYNLETPGIIVSASTIVRRTIKRAERADMAPRKAKQTAEQKQAGRERVRRALDPALRLQLPTGPSNT